MSNNNYESGSIVIPSSEWAGLKKTVRDAYNAEQARRHATALKLHEEILRQAKGVRDVNWYEACQNATNALATILMDRDYTLPWEIFQSKVDPNAKRYVDPRSIRGSAGRPNKPVRKLWPDANNRTTAFSLGEAGIRFDDATRTLHWFVSENNRAVERAHEHPVAKALFKALDRIKWTRGSGGQIVGNDEINKENGRDYEGGGATYVTHSYPPAKNSIRPTRSWL